LAYGYTTRFYFIIINLLPADVQECKAYKQGEDMPAFTLRRAGKIWQYAPPEGQKRQFKCSPTKLLEWGNESRRWESFPVWQFIEKTNWKQASQIRMKEEGFSLLVGREAKALTLTRRQAGEDVVLILRY
jgi:hypothetical protein